MYFVVLCMALCMVCLALHITCRSKMGKMSEMLLAMLSTRPTLDECVVGCNCGGVGAKALDFADDLLRLVEW